MKHDFEVGSCSDRFDTRPLFPFYLFGCTGRGGIMDYDDCSPYSPVRKVRLHQRKQYKYLLFNKIYRGLVYATP